MNPGNLPESISDDGTIAVYTGPRWTVLDDGTLDTVARCNTCGRVTRFDTGSLLPEDCDGLTVEDLESERLDALETEDCPYCEDPQP